MCRRRKVRGADATGIALTAAFMAAAAAAAVIEAYMTGII